MNKKCMALSISEQMLNCIIYHGDCNKCKEFQYPRTAHYNPEKNKAVK